MTAGFDPFLGGSDALGSALDLIEVDFSSGVLWTLVVFGVVVLVLWFVAEYLSNRAWLARLERRQVEAGLRLVEDSACRVERSQHRVLSDCWCVSCGGADVRVTAAGSSVCLGCGGGVFASPPLARPGV